MSKSSFFLFVFATIVSTTTLSAQSDACPSWNKKQAKTSTNYAALSKRSAADNTSDFSKPKYQSIYAKNTASTTISKRGRAYSAPAKAAPAKAEKRVATVPEQKNTSSKAIRTPVNEEEAKKAILTEEENKTTPETEKETATKTAEIPTAANEATPSAAKASGKGKEKTAATLKKEKQAEAAKSSQQKQQRKAAVRKLRIGKKKATDCPDF
ncbi:MAG: hypothetical protein IPP64_12290 [Bacteroidetes bacterium]|nr:hypothetical protein [Bacteroidota bacterium]